MATQADVRRIAMSLPAVEESTERFGFSVRSKDKAKGFIWVWMERVDPKKPRIPNNSVLAVRVANLAQKDLILASNAKKFFTEPHYNGFPAVLVRLGEVTVSDLEALLPEAWRCMAPRDLLDPAALKPKAKHQLGKSAKKTQPPPKRRQGRSR